MVLNDQLTKKQQEMYSIIVNNNTDLKNSFTEQSE